MDLGTLIGLLGVLVPVCLVGLLLVCLFPALVSASFPLGDRLLSPERVSFIVMKR
jgi:hypothetical protein